MSLDSFPSLTAALDPEEALVVQVEIALAEGMAWIADTQQQHLAAAARRMLAEGRSMDDIALIMAEQAALARANAERWRPLLRAKIIEGYERQRQVLH